MVISLIKCDEFVDAQNSVVGLSSSKGTKLLYLVLMMSKRLQGTRSLDFLGNSITGIRMYSFFLLCNKLRKCCLYYLGHLIQLNFSSNNHLIKKEKEYLSVNWFFQIQKSEKKTRQKLNFFSNS